MTEIRYWGGSTSAHTVHDTQTRKRHDALSRYTQDFQSELLDYMQPKSVGSAMATGKTNSLAGAFGGKGPQLMDLDVPGIEKVWAAQLSMPEAYLNLGGDSQQNNSADLTGLSSMIDLTVQQHMLRARQSLGEAEYAFDELVDDLETIESLNQGVDNSSYDSLEAFVSAMQQQIEQASRQFGVAEGEIEQRLTSDMQEHDETQRRRIRTW
ncbi:MAG: hypothetical protein OEZ43_17615 [Gammaproteobacteria bacterium]|nr:hypothetical protein [Gammaproteobacteria bacterium]